MWADSERVRYIINIYSGTSEQQPHLGVRFLTFAESLVAFRRLLNTYLYLLLCESFHIY